MFKIMTSLAMRRQLRVAPLLCFLLCPSYSLADPVTTQWFKSEIGSEDFPYGLEVFSRVCPWAGVFSHDLISAEAEFENYSDGEVQWRMLLYFLAISGATSIDFDSLDFASARLLLRSIAEVNFHRADRFESDSAMRGRVEDELNAVLGQDRTVSFVAGEWEFGVVRFDGIKGLSGFVPTKLINNLDYDANAQQFLVNDRKLRLVQKRRIPGVAFFSGEPLRPFGFAVPSFFETPHISAAADSESAREYAPYLFTVITGQVDLTWDETLKQFAPINRSQDSENLPVPLDADSTRDLLPVMPTKIEIRNICTNEVLVSRSFTQSDIEAMSPAGKAKSFVEKLRGLHSLGAD